MFKYLIKIRFNLGLVFVEQLQKIRLYATRKREKDKWGRGMERRD